MKAGTIEAEVPLVDEVRFAFQPLINVRTGGVVAVEALARPTGATVHDLFRDAVRKRRLTELDVHLAVSALAAAAEQGTILPLHLNIFGGTVAHDFAGLDALRTALHRYGRRSADVTLEIGPPFARLDPQRVIDGANQLRSEGFNIALDGVGEGDVPLALISDLAPDLVKLDRGVIDRLPDDQGRTALLEGLRHLCSANDCQLVAEGVENDHQLTALRRNGIRLVQGNLLAPAARRPPATLTLPGVAAEVTDPDLPAVSTTATGPRVTEFLSPATLLPADATADAVRQVLADQPQVSGVVLVDEHNRPRWSIDRNRFLLAVTGPYGHALHAQRPASRLADAPRVISTTTTAMEAIEIVTRGDQQRMFDDAVVVDESGRCLGAVRAAHLIRGMADLKVEEAVALNPLTRLPGSEAVERDIARRVSAGEAFAVSWLDVDGFKGVNDNVGFAAGDEVIRSVGRSLTDAATSFDSVRVAHVGGDDFLLVAGLDDLEPMSKMVLDPPRQVEGVPVSLSLATVILAPGTVDDYAGISRMLAPLKRRAKALHGPSWVACRSDSQTVGVLRGQETAPSPQ